MRALLPLMMCVACGGATSAKTPGAFEPCWPLGPMRVLAVTNANAPELFGEIQGDGTIWVLEHGSRKLVGRVTHDALLDPDGAPLITCVHREVSLGSTSMRGHYDADDAFVMDGRRVIVRDDGTVTMDGRSTGTRFEGAIAGKRRTAILLLLAGMISAPLMPTP